MRTATPRSLIDGGSALDHGAYATRYGLRNSFSAGVGRGHGGRSRPWRLFVLTFAPKAYEPVPS
jgi:hypothetical protein